MAKSLKDHVEKTHSQKAPENNLLMQRPPKTLLDQALYLCTTIIPWLPNRNPLYND